MRVKLQPGVVFRVKVVAPDVKGVPVADNTTFWTPVPVNVPDPEKVTPFTVVVIV